jgi:hypothetical protein
MGGPIEETAGFLLSCGSRQILNVAVSVVASSVPGPTPAWHSWTIKMVMALRLPHPLLVI